MRLFRIVENLNDRGGAPLMLVDDKDTVVRIGDRSDVLADIAFEELGATVVRHDHKDMRKEWRL